MYILLIKQRYPVKAVLLWHLSKDLSLAPLVFIFSLNLSFCLMTEPSQQSVYVSLHLRLCLVPPVTQYACTRTKNMHMHA